MLDSNLNNKKLDLLYEQYLKTEFSYDLNKFNYIVLYGSSFSIDIQRNLNKKLEKDNSKLVLVKQKHLKTLFSDIIDVSQIFQGNLFLLKVPVQISQDSLLSVLSMLKNNLGLEILLAYYFNKIYYLDLIIERLSLNSSMYNNTLTVLNNSINKLSFVYNNLNSVLTYYINTNKNK